jgi:hypothetical protein
MEQITLKCECGELGCLRTLVVTALGKRLNCVLADKDHGVFATFMLDRSDIPKLAAVAWHEGVMPARIG